MTLERAYALIDALNKQAPCGMVLHGALQAVIIAKANSMLNRNRQMIAQKIVEEWDGKNVKELLERIEREIA